MNIASLQDTWLIYKSNCFLYISIEQLVFEIKNTIPFILAPINKIFRYESKKVSTESKNYKTL